MLQIISHPEMHVSAATATGTLTAEDYAQKILPDLRMRLGLYPKVSRYFHMDGFTGWTPGALWDDITFGLAHARDFRKIALVGDAKWGTALVPLLGPFTSATVKFFPKAEKEEAWLWVGTSTVAHP